MKKFRCVIGMSEDLLEFFDAEAWSRVQTLMGLKRASKSLVLELLVTHFKENQPTDSWVVDAITRRRFSERRPGRPRGAKDISQRAKWPLDGKRPIPKEIVKGKIIASMLNAMLKNDDQWLFNMREEAQQANLPWQQLETEARKDFDQHHGGNTKRDDSDRSSRGSVGGGD